MNKITLASEFFKALSHPLRLQIIEALSKGDKSVSELHSITKKSDSILSQQLAILRHQNIISAQRSGKCMFYTLNSQLEIKKLLNITQEILKKQLSVSAFSISQTSLDHEVEL